MMVKSDSTSRLGVEQSGIVRDVIVFIASHFGQRVVSFQNGQSFAEKFQRLALEQFAENRARILDQFSSMVFENHRKSLIHHCELSLHFEQTKINLEMRKMVNFDEFLQTWSLRLTSVTRQLN